MGSDTHRSERHRLAWLLLVAAGALAAHAGGYMLAHPDPSLRAAALEGHGYLGLAIALIVPAAAVAVGWLAVVGARAVRLGNDLHPGRLAVAQALLFSTVEVLERLPAGDPAAVLHEPAVLIGLLVQLPIAAALVVLVRAVRHVAIAFRAPAPRRRWSASVSWALPAAPQVAPVALLSHTARGRGPPRRVVDFIGS